MSSNKGSHQQNNNHSAGSENNTSHDQNFKNLILDYPIEAIEFYAPSEAKKLPLHELKVIPIRQEQLKKALHGRFRALDTPVLLQYPDGRRKGIIFAFEEESRTRDFSIHRLAHYCLDLSELFKLETVIPVVIFLQKSTRAQKELRLGNEETTFLGFRYLYCSLAELNYLDWRESNNRVAVLNLPCMQYKKSEKLAMYHYATKQFFKLEKRRNLVEKYIDFIDYYAKFSDNDFEEFEQQYPQEGKVMKTFSQRHKEAGVKEGMQAGIQKGIIEGELSSLINTLLMLLETRFGEVPAQVNKKVKQAQTEQLNTWIKNTLTADSLESVFA